MSEETKDVKPSEESSAPEQNPVETTEQEQSQSVENVSLDNLESTTPEQGQSSQYDEKGVSYQNRYMETKRKYEALLDEMPAVAQKAAEIALQNSGQAQNREPTEEELDEFVEKHPEHAKWVERKKFELHEKKILKKFEDKLRSQEINSRNEQMKIQSFNYVRQTYPECFVKDNAGNVVWNVKNPMVQSMNAILSDPELKNNPRALMVASDAAFANYVRKYGYDVAKKNSQLSAENKALQKQTMFEGSGKKAATEASNAYRDSIEKAKQSGKLQDAHAAMEAIFKAQRNRTT